MPSSRILFLAGPLGELRDHWFPTNGVTVDGWPLLQVGGLAPADATTSQGWYVEGVAAGQFSRMEAGVIRAAETFGATPQPSGGPDNTLKDGYRTENKWTVSEPPGDWTFPIPAIAVLGAGASVRLRIRLWVSDNADMSSPTEVTSGAVVGTSITDLQAGTASLSTCTATLGAVAFTAKYIQLQIAAETV
jgi:hypothetical protein